MTVDAEALQARLDAVDPDDIPDRVLAEVDVTNVTFILDTLGRAQDLIAAYSHGVVPDAIIEAGTLKVRLAMKQLAGEVLEGIVEELDAE